MVGRDGERAWLREAIETVAGGCAGTSMLIKAPAGFGKTMLAQWAVQQASVRHGLWSWVVQFDPVGAQRPLGAVADALAVVRRAGDGTAADLVEAILRTEPEELTASVSAAPVIDRVVDYVADSSRARGGLVLLDDLQWADRASAVAAQALIRALPTSRTLIVVTAREPLDPPLSSLEDQVRSSGGMIAELEPLTHDEIAELAGVFCVPATPEVLELLHTANGQPLLTAELVRVLAEDSASAAWITSSAPLADAPQRLQEVILRRLHSMPPAAASLLRAAAVLGTGFTVGQCAALLDTHVTQLITALTTCFEHGLLDETDGEGLAFRHDLIREAIYTSLPRGIAAAMHLHAADVVAETGAPAQRVADHLLRATEQPAVVSVDVIIRHAENIAGDAPRTAAQLLDRALVLADDPHSRDMVQQRLAHLLPSVGEPARAEHLARDLLDQARSGAQAADARIALARALFAQGRVTDTVALLTDVRNDLRSSAQTRLVGEAAFFLSATGDLGTAAKYADDAIHLDQSHPDDVGAVAALVTQAMRHGYSGRFIPALAAALSAHDRARAATSRQPFRYVPAFAVANAMANLDRWDEAQRWLRQLADEVAAYSIVWAEPVVSFGRIVFCWFTGDWETALTESTAAQALAAETGIVVTEAMAQIIPALIHLERGDIHTARTMTQQAAAAIAARPASYGADWLPWLNARIASATGEHLLAETIMTQTWAALDQAETRWGHYAFGMDLVRHLTGTGQTGRARRYADQLTDLAEDMTSPSAVAVAMRARALSYRDVAAAECAVTHAATAGRPLDLAHAQEDAAQVLAAAGDVNRATELLSAAAEICADLDAQLTMNGISSLLQEYGGSQRVRTRKRPQHGWDSLTSTEREVVRFVCTGMSNREVADQLSISRYTVETHLKRIFSKLDVRSRTELAHVAAPRLA